MYIFYRKSIVLNLHVGPDLGHTPDRIEKRKKPVPGWIQTHDLSVSTAVLQLLPLVKEMSLKVSKAFALL